MVCGGDHKSFYVEQQRADFIASAQLRATSERNHTPQRDEAAIARWRTEVWEELKKRRAWNAEP